MVLIFESDILYILRINNSERRPHMKYQKPRVLIYDEKIMNEILAVAGSGTCKCGNGTSQNGSLRARA